MEKKYFLHQAKHNKTNDTIDKGIVVKDTLEEVKQAYHAYLGAYGYGNNADTDFVQCGITDSDGNDYSTFDETWIAPEPEAHEESIPEVEE